MKVVQHRSIILLNFKCPQLSKPKARQQWQGTKTLKHYAAIKEWKNYANS